MTLRAILSEFKLYCCNHFIKHIPSYTVRLFFYRKIMRFTIGKGSYIFMGCTFDACDGLTMGIDSVINANCRVDTRGGVQIGNNVSISNNTTIITADHDMDNNMDGRSKPVVIEDYVWVGTEAMLLPGAYISMGSVVAARALVTKAFKEKNCVVAGVPARVIKVRENPTFNYSSSYKRLFQ